MMGSRATEIYKDELIARLRAAIREFSDYQAELMDSLDKDPLAVLKEQGHWNNQHQKAAAIVQFFVKAFTDGLAEGLFAEEEGLSVAQELKCLHGQENRLLDKVSAIRDRIARQRKDIESGMAALSGYSHFVNENAYSTAQCLSRDA